MGGKESDIIFKWLLDKTKKQKENYPSWLKYHAVRIGWWFPIIGKKWKHRRKDNIIPIPDNVKLLNQKIIEGIY